MYANQAYCDMTGYSKSELIGVNPGQLLQRNAHKSRQAIREKIDTLEPINIMVQNYKKDDTMFWNELHLYPVFDEEKCIYWVGLATDITDRMLNIAKNLDSFSHSVKNTFHTAKTIIDNSFPIVSPRPSPNSRPL